METTLSQMNIRLASSVKEAGDAALLKLGVTPTEFVRKVWEQLAQGGDASAKMSDVVLGRPEASAANASAKRLALEHMRKHYELGMERLGIDVERVPVSSDDVLPDRELYADALVDRMIGRGTWEA